MPVSPEQTLANMGCGPVAQLQQCEAADTSQAPQLSAQNVQHNHCQDLSFAEAVEEYNKLVAQNRIEEHELVLRHLHPQPEPEVLSTDTIEKKGHSDKPMSKNLAQKTIIIDLGSESEDEVDEPTGGVSNKTNNTPQHVQPIESGSKSTPAAKPKNGPDDATNPGKRYVRRPRRRGQWWSVSLEDWERLSEREKQKRSEIPAARPSLKRARPSSPALQATDMKKEPDGPQREDYKDNMTVPTRSSTAVTHSRSSNNKKLRRISIDLTED
ncbi:hypothetical protein SLS58_003110 [Diplodia intermedia]|uniref:Uncharacterized protein n=1 Tax=Diplodia intermedia TaxID=856260 RepID=A0ABR3TXQ7_9PEZI